MQVLSPARRLVAACATAALLAPASAQAATQQEVAESVAAGAGWLRTQQNLGTGELAGFGGDYALSALSAAGASTRPAPRRACAHAGRSGPGATR